MRKHDETLPLAARSKQHTYGELQRNDYILNSDCCCCCHPSLAAAASTATLTTSTGPARSTLIYLPLSVSFCISLQTEGTESLQQGLSRLHFIDGPEAVAPGTAAITITK